jgi:hypothetical protein
MNAPGRHFVTRFAGGRVLQLGAGIGVVLLLNGCASYNPFATARVDSTSPVAAEVAAKARANKDYPSFREIPKAPTDVRPLAAWGDAVREVASAGERLERETAPGTWTLNPSDTQGFAARARAEVGPEGDVRSTSAASEAFAREIRERATPPPPPR